MGADEARSEHVSSLELRLGETVRVWTVSEEKAGTLTQCLGVASYLDADPVAFKVGRLPRWRKGLLSPYRSLSAPEPDVVISCGRLAERHVARILERYGKRPLTVHLQPPGRESSGLYDHAFVSRHDWRKPRLSDTRYHEMIGVPHRVTRDLLQDRRQAARARWLGEEGEGRIVAFLLGGPNDAYDYDFETIAAMRQAMETLAGDGWCVLACTSRRSRPDLLDALLRITDPNVHVWAGSGENPYLDYLSAADAFVIAKDSVTMHCEALMSGRPVYSFELAHVPGERLEKFEWLHRDLQETLGLTRPFTGPLEPYAYEFAGQAELIARTIGAELVARREVVAGAAPDR